MPKGRNRPKGKSRRRLIEFFYFIQGGDCLSCGRRMLDPELAYDRRKTGACYNTSSPTIEHITPSSVAHDNRLSNLCVTCFRCNQDRRSDALPRDVELRMRAASDVAVSIRSVGHIARDIRKSLDTTAAASH